MARHVAVLGEAIRAAGGVAASDRELLERFTAGEQAAFAALFRRHVAMVLGVCRRALPTLQDAEDACQATFLLLSRKAGSGRWQPSVANWLYLTARRVARNARVAARRRARREGKAAVPAAVQPVDRMTGRELLEALDAELDRLPPAYREPLVLCYLEGLTRDETALRLGLPPATVKTRLERGRKRLGEALTRRGCVAGAGLLALAATSPAGASSPGLMEKVLAATDGQVPGAVALLARGTNLVGVVKRSVAALVVLTGTAALGLGLVSAGLPGEQPAPELKAASGGPQQKMERPPAGAMAPGTKTTDKPSQATTRPLSRTITGRVVGPDGLPVPGAKLFVPAMHAKALDAPAVSVQPDATADGGGRFTLTVTPVDKDSPQIRLIGYAPGLGVDWLQFGGPGDPELPAEPVLRLKPDVPINGRIVNTEGKPVAGVSVSVFAVCIPADEKLDTFLSGWRERKFDIFTMQRSLYLLPGDLGLSKKTDRDGRFSVRGVGAERVAYLDIEGGGLAKSRAYVATRDRYTPKSAGDGARNLDQDELWALNRIRGVYGPEFTLIAEPGREITGTVTDVGTGEPIAGCRVSAFAGMGCDLRTTSDAGGRFRLFGLPKSNRPHSVFVSPPDGSRYLMAELRPEDTEGLAPMRVDARLAKGVTVTGRVIDRQTGKGVSASVRFDPLPGNKFYGSKPGFVANGNDLGTGSTDRDGRFRVTTIPGPALIMVQAGEGERLDGQFVNPYRAATPDPDHKELFRREGELLIVITASNFVAIASNENAVKVVDVKATGETSVDLFLDRGMTGKLAVQDDDGRPLAGAWVAGLADKWPITYRLPEPTATVYALDPAKPRTLAVYHPGKRLGGTFTIRGDETGPVVAKLGQMARATGRLVDSDGRPLAGADVSIEGFRQVDSELYRFAVPAGLRTVTGKDGRFSLDGIVPGVRFQLRVQKGKDHYTAKPRLAWRRLEPGEQFDFGDRTVVPNQ